MIHPNAQKVNANLPNANFPPILLSYLEIALACEVPEERASNGKHAKRLPLRLRSNGVIVSNLTVQGSL